MAEGKNDGCEIGFAWRYPELYRLMYGLDGVISEPEKERLRIEDVAALNREPSSKFVLSIANRGEVK